MFSAGHPWPRQTPPAVKKVRRALGNLRGPGGGSSAGAAGSNPAAPTRFRCESLAPGGDDGLGAGPHPAARGWPSRSRLVQLGVDEIVGLHPYLFSNASRATQYHFRRASSSSCPSAQRSRFLFRRPLAGTVRELGVGPERADDADEALLEVDHATPVRVACEARQLLGHLRELGMRGEPCVEGTRHEAGP